jgi:hypothetical protein
MAGYVWWELEGEFVSVFTGRGVIFAGFIGVK